MTDMTSDAGDSATQPEEAVAPPPPPPEASTPPPPPPPPPPSSSPNDPQSEWGPPGAIRGPLFVILIGIVTCGIYWVYWWFKAFEELKVHTKKGLGGGWALAIVLVGGFFCGGLPTIVLGFMLPGEIEDMYRRLGKSSPVSALWGLWWLLPVVGPIIWLVKVQNGMNDRWEELGVVKT